MMVPYLVSPEETSDADELPHDASSSPPPPDAPRWHMSGPCPPNGERCPRTGMAHDHTYIMYGEEEAVYALAGRLGYRAIESSGWYSYVTNTIVDAQDGPTSFVDCRKSGGGSRG